MIKDFNPTENDKLKISGFGADLDEFAELSDHISLSPDELDTIIDLTSLGGGMIVLEGFVEDLEAGDVILIP